MNLVDYPIIAHANSESALRVGEFLRTMWKRLLGELFDGREDSCHLLPGEIAQILFGGTAPMNVK